MLRFKRGIGDKPSIYTAEWQTGEDRDRRYIAVNDSGIAILGSLLIGTPADLAELERVLHAAAVVAGWREQC